MKAIKVKQLPPIFKFSSLCNILPYFGYLHEWKVTLELLWKDTALIWSNNKDALFNLGSNDQRELNLDYIRSPINLPNNPELFWYSTNWFCYLFNNIINNAYMNLQGIKHLILQFVNKLSENNFLMIYDWQDFPLGRKYIEYLSKYEVKELLPSNLWTSVSSNIKLFANYQAEDLCKYIAEKIKTRNIILKRLNDGLIEVNSVLPMLIWFSQEYNILNNRHNKNLNECYSWPVVDCPWKPISLILRNNLIDNDRSYDEIEEINNETTKQILSLNYLENIKELDIHGDIRDLESIDNLTKISKRFPKTDVTFTFEYNYNSSNYKESIKIKSRQAICVFKGKEWCFELDNDNDRLFPLSFSEFKPVKNESFVIIKVDYFYWISIISRLDYWLDKRKQATIDKLKKDTEFNDCLYVVADISEISIKLNLKDLSKYISCFKYWNLIEIEVGDSKTEFKQEITKINKLPKNYKYKIILLKPVQFIKSHLFGMMISSFEDMQIYANNLIIRVNKTESKIEKLGSERMFRVFCNFKKQSIIVNYSKLKEIISKL